MRLPEDIEADLSQDEKSFCRKALAVCQKYPHAAHDNWVAAILLYLLESYLRLAIAMDPKGRGAH